LMPSALATLVGAIAQPSLLLSTINGRLRSSVQKRAQRSSRSYTRRYAAPFNPDTFYGKNS
jgi:hypothetical protein